MSTTILQHFRINNKITTFLLKVASQGSSKAHSVECALLEPRRGISLTYSSFISGIFAGKLRLPPLMCFHLIGLRISSNLIVKNIQDKLVKCCLVNDKLGVFFTLHNLALYQTEVDLAVIVVR